MDLFDTPNDSPISLAKALEKQHEMARCAMRKGRDYNTLELRSAKMLRWLAHNRPGPQAVSTSNDMIRNANNRILSLRKTLERVSLFFGCYIVLSIYFIIRLLR